VGKHHFRYEVAWEGAESFSDQLKETWAAGGQCATLAVLQHKISNLSCEMAHWGCHSVGSVQTEMRSLQWELESLRGAHDHGDPGSRELEIVAKLKILLDQEEVMWSQRSRVQWLAAISPSSRDPMVQW
jgi:hypothetical protein